jgi:hypothetical protein
MPPEVVRRRRLVAVVAAVLVVAAIVVGVVLAAGGGSSGPPIATAAAKLVPANALVYVNLSTDGDRDQVARARELGGAFSSYTGLRDQILSQLVVGADAKAVSGWLGDEAALALITGTSGSAGSLVLLSVADTAKAKAFVAAGAKESGPGKTYKGVALSRYGAVYAAFIGDFLVLGQELSLHQAIDLQQGRGTALAADPTFRRTSDALPTDRVADAYATSDGLRRLLAPAGGVLGAVGVLLDRPGLKGTAVALRAGSPGAQLDIRSAVPGHTGTAFDPKLLDAVPKSAMAVYDTTGLDQSATRLLAGAGTTQLADLLAQFQKALGAQGVKEIRTDVIDLLSSEGVVALLPGVPAPTALVIAHAKDQTRTRTALAKLSATLPKLLKGAKVSTSPEGVTTVRSSSAEFDLAVIGGNIVLSTSAKGIAAVRNPEGGITQSPAYAAAVEKTQNPVTSVVFLDFSQLLSLAEQTGLNDSRAYLAVKADLHKVRSVGAVSSGAGEDTTTEIRIQTP